MVWDRPNLRCNQTLQRGVGQEVRGKLGIQKTELGVKDKTWQSEAFKAMRLNQITEAMSGD